jgi:hypothetical protein
VAEKGSSAIVLATSAASRGYLEEAYDVGFGGHIGDDSRTPSPRRVLRRGHSDIYFVFSGVELASKRPGETLQGRLHYLSGHYPALDQDYRRCPGGDLAGSDCFCAFLLLIAQGGG